MSLDRPEDPFWWRLMASEDIDAVLTAAQERGRHCRLKRRQRNRYWAVARRAAAVHSPSGSGVLRLNRNESLLVAQALAWMLDDPARLAVIASPGQQAAMRRLHREAAMRMGPGAPEAA